MIGNKTKDDFPVVFPTFGIHNSRKHIHSVDAHHDMIERTGER